MKESENLETSTISPKEAKKQDKIDFAELVDLLADFFMMDKIHVSYLIRFFLSVRRKDRNYKIDEPEDVRIIEIRKMNNELIQKLKNKGDNDHLKVNV